MNITITIPKSEKDNWVNDIEQLKNKNVKLHFKIPFLLKNTKKGDKCFVIIDNKIIGYHTIDDIGFKDEFICSTTKKHWPAGYYITRSSNSWNKLNNPIESKSHRGVHYTKLG